MPRRYGVNVQLWVYRFLVLRDGEQCALCFELPGVQNGRRQKLDIDHLDGNPDNNDPDNLRLLCPRCNIATRNKALSGQSYSPRNVCVNDRERKEGKPATRVVRQAVNYRQGSPEMQASFLFEVDFRNWLLDKVREQGGLPREDAVAAGAEIVGCSPSTTARYLSKLTSSAGPLQEQKDMLGDIHLVLKDHLINKEKPTIKLDELLANRKSSTDVLKGEQDNEEKELDTLSRAGRETSSLPLF